MMNIRLFAGFSLLLSSSIALATPFNDGFAMKAMDKYLENVSELHYDVGFEKQPGMKGAYCLRVRCENQKSAEFIPVKLIPGAKYKLSFRTKFVGKATVEKNPTLILASKRGNQRSFRYVPSFALTYLDAAGKALRASYAKGIPFGEWKKQEFDFFAPPKAASLRLSFNSGINNGVLYVDDVRFNLVADDRNNISLTFVPNVEKDGRQLHNTTYGEDTSIFPLQPESEYSITFKGSEAWGYHAVFIYFYDDNLKMTGKRKPLKDPLNKTMTIRTPKRTKWGKFLIYNHLLSEIEVKRVK